MPPPCRVVTRMTGVESTQMVVFNEILMAPTRPVGESQRCHRRTLSKTSAALWSVIRVRFAGNAGNECADVANFFGTRWFISQCDAPTF